jgi:hypothetical protein
MNQPSAVRPPLFPLGRVVATPGALAALAKVGQSPWEYVQRHQQGEWGDLHPDDRHANERALQDGSRLFSAYTLPNSIRLWIITESDRSCTTALLPLEY